MGDVLAVVGLFYYMQVARSMYMTPPDHDRPFRAPPALMLSVVLCLVGVVAFGAWPRSVLDDATRATQPFVSARAALLR